MRHPAAPLARHLLRARYLIDRAAFRDPFGNHWRLTRRKPPTGPPPG
ncbi:hypothetical protein [Streptomyces buecherae]